ncbi:keratin, type II cytoskeletal 1-like [Anopheles arabiensis]|nr:keratin, type II cytoskeletal 1-like [Anopheles arabiensis]
MLKKMAKILLLLSFCGVLLCLTSAAPAYQEDASNGVQSIVPVQEGSPVVIVEERAGDDSDLEGAEAAHFGYGGGGFGHGGGFGGGFGHGGGFGGGFGFKKFGGYGGGFGHRGFGGGFPGHGGFGGGGFGGGGFVVGGGFIKGGGFYGKK